MRAVNGAGSDFTGVGSSLNVEGAFFKQPHREFWGLPCGDVRARPSLCSTNLRIYFKQGGSGHLDDLYRGRWNDRLIHQHCGADHKERCRVDKRRFRKPQACATDKSRRLDDIQLPYGVVRCVASGGGEEL